MRTSAKNVNPSLKKQITKTFIQVVADLKNLDETESFLKDFFTEKEVDAFAKRLAITYWLRKKRSYGNIKENLKVSSATIAAGQTMMDKEGIKLALKKIEAEEWANQWAEKIRKFTKKIG